MSGARREDGRAPAGDSELTAISLFTGAGGLDLGCEQAGFRTKAAVECDELAQQTLIANRERHLPAPAAGALFGDIVTLDYESLLDAAALRTREVDLLHGGAPCTPFSKSGYWLAYKRAGEDPKASLLDNYVEALLAIRPKALLMENVYVSPTRTTTARSSSASSPQRAPPATRSTTRSSSPRITAERSNRLPTRESAAHRCPPPARRRRPSAARRPGD